MIEVTKTISDLPDITSALTELPELCDLVKIEVENEIEYKNMIVHTIVCNARLDKNLGFAQSYIRDNELEIGKFLEKNKDNYYLNHKDKLYPKYWNAFESISTVVQFLESKNDFQSASIFLAELTAKMFKSFRNNYKMNGMQITLDLFFKCYKELNEIIRKIKGDNLSTNEIIEINRKVDEVVCVYTICKLKGIDLVFKYPTSLHYNETISERLKMVSNEYSRIDKLKADHDNMHKKIKKAQLNMVKQLLNLMGVNPGFLKSKNTMSNILEFTLDEKIVEMYNRYLDGYENYKFLHYFLSVKNLGVANEQLVNVIGDSKITSEIILESKFMTDISFARKYRKELISTIVRVVTNNSNTFDSVYYQKGCNFYSSTSIEIPDGLLEDAISINITKYLSNPVGLSRFFHSLYLTLVESMYINSLTSSQKENSPTNQIRRVIDMNEEVSTELDNLRKENAELKSDNHRLLKVDNLLEQKYREVKQLSNEVNQLNSEKEILNTENEKLKEEIERLRRFNDTQEPHQDELAFFEEYISERKVYLVGGYDAWSNSIQSQFPSITPILADSLSLDIKSKFKSGNTTAIFVTPYNSHPMQDKTRTAVASNPTNHLIMINEHYSVNRFVKEINDLVKRNYGRR